MEQFDLKEYHDNPLRKVVTRDGRKARIICTDSRDLNFPIIALIENESGRGEKAYSYTKDGRHYTDCLNIFDLFFAPEKHEGWVNILRAGECRYMREYIYDSKEKAEEMAKENINCIATIKVEWEE